MLRDANDGQDSDRGDEEEFRAGRQTVGLRQQTVGLWQPRLQFMFKIKTLMHVAEK